MLEIYENLFNELNEEEINYCIYKGLNHLEEDLNGEKGDIDILIRECDIFKFNEIAIKNNFFKVQKNNKPIYYMGIDSITHKFVMLDVDTKVELGPKPYRPYGINIDTEKLLENSELGRVKTLNLNNYIPLMFITRTLSLSQKEEDLVEIQKLLNIRSHEEGYIIDFLNEKVGLNWNQVRSSILKTKNLKELRKEYLKIISDKISVDNQLKFKQDNKFIFRKIKGIIKWLKIPSYRIRKTGYLIAFVGVDGAGKSSTVDYIKDLDFFKFTGIKRIYFGSNEYWIPGLLFLIKKEFKNKFVRIFLSTFASIDKQLRIIKALYYIFLGNIVLADRYYYDNEIGREMIKNIPKKKSILRTIYGVLFDVRMLRKPELTFFLDVSPEVAYSRKQDYSYEKMLVVNKAYKDYMYKLVEVKVINADESQSKIYSEIVSEILKLDRKNDKP